MGVPRSTLKGRDQLSYLGCQDQEDEEQRHPEDDRDRHTFARLLLLVGHADVIIAHLLRHHLLENLFQRVIAWSEL